jgi:hypothetical protein
MVNRQSVVPFGAEVVVEEALAKIDSVGTEAGLGTSTLVEVRVAATTQR